ncbi:MAG: hypothetical protein FJ028_08060 [Chloroflexi bacterium]|nr:hypothetical protein [Chloroflexota bacterium]
MRRVILSIAILATVGLLVAAAVPAAADPGDDPAGSNGTVKVRDWPDHKNGSDMANDPKVCDFELHGFGFDGGQSGPWWIQEHKRGGGDRTRAVLSGTRSANGSGDWTSGPHRLGDGHYKLFVEMSHRAGTAATRS